MRAALTIEANLAYLQKVRQFIAEHAQPVCPDEGFIYDLTLAVDEIVTNIILHGYQGNPGKIHLILQKHADRLECVLRDEARPFDPTQVPTPDIKLPLEKRIPGGLGIFLARTLTDQMSYRRLPEGSNEVRMSKVLPGTAAET